MKDFKKSGGFGPKRFGAKSFASKRPAFGDRPVERFQATCNECQKLCEVPFKPNGKKPVYCRDCFKGKEEAPAFGAPREFRKSESGPHLDLSKEFQMLNLKLDRLISAIESKRGA